MAHGSADSAPRRRVLEELASLSEDQLLNELRETQSKLDAARSELDEAARKIRIYEAEEQVVAQMLRIVQWKRDGVPGAAGTVEALRDSEMVARERTISANVLTVVKQAGIPLGPAEVLDRLAVAGVQTDANSVRSALRRWVERDMLEKVGTKYRRHPNLIG